MFTIYKDEIQRLIQNIEGLRQTLNQNRLEFNQLSDRNKKLEIIVKEKELIIEDIEYKYKTLLNAKEFSAGLTGTENAKTKINTLVREIDKCLALLND